MPQSRHRKINKAKRRPRVAPSSGSAVAASPKVTSNRNLRIGAIVVMIILAASVVAYLISSSRGPQAGPEVTTASGLKMQDLKVGEGASPKPGQTITVHYVGTLDNGTEFDSSYRKGKPIDFRIGVGAVIKGWEEGVATMKVGGKRRLVVPPELGYGAQARPSIPPNSRLNFEVELLGVK